MIEPKRKKVILFVDDDEDDYLVLRDIFRETSEDVELRWIKDGERALDYLVNRNPRAAEGNHAADGPAARPYLIILDLNMPKIGGRDVLSQIKSHDDLRHIPVVVFTNSMNKEEALDAYRLKVNSFMRKPAGYKELQEFVRVFYRYWFDYSTLI